jgi:multidrug resistance efflux pump
MTQRPDTAPETAPPPDGPASGDGNQPPSDGAIHDHDGRSSSPTTTGPASGPSGFRRMKRSSRLALIVIACLALLAALGFGASYLIYTRNYVSTDNAQVDGDRIDINAPMTGTLTGWSINKGSPIRDNQVVGRVKILGSFAQAQRPIKSPGNGTVAVTNVVDGQFVTAGQQLATGYDFSKIYITARVDETDIGAVQPGQLVDVDVDAYPGVPVTGIVQEIQGAAAAMFSLFPEQNSTGNFQKVTQVIPVKIAIANAAGRDLVPGMNVTVHIDKRTAAGSSGG